MCKYNVLYLISVIISSEFTSFCVDSGKYELAECLIACQILVFSLKFFFVSFILFCCFAVCLLSLSCLCSLHLSVQKNEIKPIKKQASSRSQKQIFMNLGTCVMLG